MASVPSAASTLGEAAQLEPARGARNGSQVNSIRPGLKISDTVEFDIATPSQGRSPRRAGDRLSIGSQSSSFMNTTKSGEIHFDDAAIPMQQRRSSLGGSSSYPAGGEIGGWSSRLSVWWNDSSASKDDKPRGQATCRIHTMGKSSTIASDLAPIEEKALDSDAQAREDRSRTTTSAADPGPAPEEPPSLMGSVQASLLSFVCSCASRTSGPFDGQEFQGPLAFDLEKPTPPARHSPAGSPS